MRLLTFCFSIIMLNAFLTTGQAIAQTESVLYTFGLGSDGGYPRAGLIIDKQGNFYGTSYYGGSLSCKFGCGGVYKLTPSGAETVLYRFSRQPSGPVLKVRVDGAYPASGVILDSQGNLYGTTVAG